MLSILLWLLLAPGDGPRDRRGRKDDRTTDRYRETLGKLARITHDPEQSGRPKGSGPGAPTEPPPDESRTPKAARQGSRREPQATPGETMPPATPNETMPPATPSEPMAIPPSRPVKIVGPVTPRTREQAQQRRAEAEARRKAEREQRRRANAQARSAAGGSVTPAPPSARRIEPGDPVPPTLPHLPASARKPQQRDQGEKPEKVVVPTPDPPTLRPPRLPGLDQAEPDATVERGPVTSPVPEPPPAADSGLEVTATASRDPDWRSFEPEREAEREAEADGPGGGAIVVPAGDRGRKPRRWRRVVVAAAVIVVVAGGVTVGLLARRPNRHHRSARPTAPSSTPSSTATTAASSTTTKLSTTKPSTTTIPATTAAPAQVRPVATDGSSATFKVSAPAKLSVSVRSPCWAQVSGSGANFEGTVNPGSDRQWNVGPGTVVRLGNASAASLRLDGRAVSLPALPAGPFDLRFVA